MSHHLIDPVVKVPPADESQNGDLQTQTMTACRLILFYEDQDSKNRAAQLCSNLRRLFSREITFEEDWWKLSVLQQPSMLQMAIDDAANADVLLYSFGCCNDVTPELALLNSAWAQRRLQRDGLLALQLQNNSGDAAELLRLYFRKIASENHMDYLATETPEDDVPSSTELYPLTRHVLARFGSESLEA
jgi:hypothetical protein